MAMELGIRKVFVHAKLSTLLCIQEDALADRLWPSVGLPSYKINDKFVQRVAVRSMLHQSQGAIQT